MLSIITINYNNLEGLKRTFISICQFFYKDNDYVEWIIVDGDSTDGSKAFILSEAVQSIPGKKISEKDSGIYNAMNKGIANAKGEYLLFLNSGDCLRQEVIDNRIIETLGPEDIIFGDWSNENGVIQYTQYPNVLSADFFILGWLSHQSTFFHRRLFEDDKYDESYLVAGDLEFIARKICKDKCSYRKIDIPICIMEKGGISASRYYDISIPERRRAISNLLEGGVEWYDAIALEKRLSNSELFQFFQEISLGSDGKKKYIRRVLKVFLWLYKTLKKISNRK